jgi:hydroxyacylglutathione hydrolase
MFNITKLVVGAFGVNCYVVSANRKALIIDPGADAGEIAKALRIRQLDIEAYLITHGHVDHISALQPLWNEWPAPVAMHNADIKWAFNPENQMPPYYPAPLRPAAIQRPLKGGETWNENGFNFQVMATPGHSPGGVCFYFPDENILFSGDTLFQGTVGRTDLPGGNMDELTRSLRSLAGLPPQTKVYPGHGPATTIAREIESNPFLK